MKKIFKLFIFMSIPFFLYGCSQNNEQVSNNEDLGSIEQVEVIQTNAPQVKNVSLDKSSNAIDEKSDDLSPDQEDIADSEEASDEVMVTVPLTRHGREDPFQPYTEKSIVVDKDTGIVPLPPKLNPENDLVNLMAAKVNGILSDKKKASAIININDQDYLVKPGDTLFNYNIVEITSERVKIKHKNNVFSASIGEVIAGNLESIDLKNSDRSKKSKKQSSKRKGSDMEEEPIIKIIHIDD